MKDVIYIDIEDDITAILGKVKAAGAKIVALVPPKRAGVLQSVVNLKLLQKGASDVGKRVVLITNEHSLVALAAGLKIPVAKNLQSRPEVPQMTPLEAPVEEVINGDELPVGELAGMSGKTADAAAIAAGAAIPVGGGDAAPIVPAKKLSVAEAFKKKGGKFNIPDFGSFRKKIFLFGGLGVLLAGFLVWALAFAPTARITISARTTAVNIDRTLTLDPGTQNSKPEDLQLKPDVQQIKKSVATEFDATGKKEVGEKATGDVTLSNASSSNAMTVPAGTRLTAASGEFFVTNSQAVVPGAQVANGNIVAGSVKVGVTASELGPDYNVTAQSYAVQGFSGLGASGTPMSGGTKEEITVVSEDDVAKAKTELKGSNDDEAKNELRQKFNSGFITIEESFMAEQGSPSVTPNVGEEAQRAKLTVETTYTLVGLVRDDIKSILTRVIDDTLENQPDQQMYSLGENAIVFQTFQRPEGGKFVSRLVTTGYIGPKIDTAALAQELAGKRYGEIQALTQAIPGVDDVEIHFSPFWVTTAPAADKIDISFSVNNDNG